MSRGWRNSLHYELHELYYSPDKIRMTKSKDGEMVDHVAHAV